MIKTRTLEHVRLPSTNTWAWGGKDREFTSS